MSLPLIAQAVDRVHELPVPAYVIGLASFLIFVVLMMGLLAFGKGRPHT